MPPPKPTTCRECRFIQICPQLGDGDTYGHCCSEPPERAHAASLIPNVDEHHRACRPVVRLDNPACRVAEKP
jgi:hypothetical protein